MITSSYRTALRSMLIIGSAQAVNVAISILRQKALAVLLGPTGIGLLSIYNNLLTMAAQGAGLGMSSSSVREIASVRDDPEPLARVRKVLLSAHLAQGCLALIAIWLLREQIAIWLFGDEGFAIQVGLVGFAVVLSLLAAAHTALLQGLRRIGDLGRVTVIGAIFGTAAGLLAVWLFGQGGLIWFLLVQPLFNLIVARWFVGRIRTGPASPPPLRDVPRIWLPMAKLGFAFMAGGLATGMTLLFLRGHISTQLGFEAAGHFAAAWGITMTYVGFLLGAMAADYYPRLTEVIANKPAAVSLMNDQAQLGLAIGGPVLLMLIGWAPWVIRLLYSEEFAPAVEILQWQSVGNIFKLASWPLGFSLAAAARGKTFLFVQINFNVIFLAVTLLGISSAGLFMTGPAFMVAYAIHFTVLMIIVSRTIGYQMAPLTRNLLVLHAGLSVTLLLLATISPPAGLAAAPVLAAGTAVFGLRTVLAKTGPEGRLAGRLTSFFQRAGWPIRTDS